ncbi:unnamed protein product, partial [Didymodactylos carnosus]
QYDLALKYANDAKSINGDFIPDLLQRICHATECSPEDFTSTDIPDGENLQNSFDLLLQGNIHLNKHDYNLSLECSEKALKGIVGDNLKLVTGIHLSIANFHLVQENYLYALKHLDQCLEIHNEFDPSNYDEKVNIHFYIGKTYHRMMNYPKALKHLLECESPRDGPSSSTNYPIFSTIYHFIGTIYFETKEYDLSLQYYTKALEVEQQTKSENTVMSAIIHYDLGKCYHPQKQYAKATEHYNKSLTIIGKTNNKNAEREMAHLNYCTEYCYLLKNNDEDDLMLKSFTKSFELLEKYSFEYDVFETMDKLSTALYTKNDSDNLLLLHFERIQLLMQKENLNEKDKIEVGDLCFDIGCCYFDAKQYNFSLRYYLQALSVQKTIIPNNKLKMSLLYSCIAYCYARQQKYNICIEHLKKSVNIQETMVKIDKKSLACSYKDLGWYYYLNDEYDQALDCSQKSLRLFESCSQLKNLEYPDVLHSIGTIYYYQSNYEQAWLY